MSESEPQVSPEARALLEELPLLEELSEEAKRLVVESFVPVSFAFGEVVFAEGDEPDGFYVLASGGARVLKQRADGEEVTLNTLRPGDGFGELGLLTGESRSATVRASAESHALKLDRALFAALLQVQPELRRHFDRELERHRRRDLLRLSSSFASLGTETTEELIDALEPVEAAKGEVVVRQGDPSTCMYVVEEGRLHAVWQTAEGSTGDVAYLRRGDLFGERSLMLGAPRAVTVEAVSGLPPARAPGGRVPAVRRGERGVPGRGRRQRRAGTSSSSSPASRSTSRRSSCPPRPPSRRSRCRATRPRRRPAREDVEEWAEEEEAPRKRIRRFKHVWQVDEMDCGAACLAMVTRHYGREVSLSHIRKVVHTGTEGTSLAGLVSGAEELGLRARAVKASKSRLSELPFPAIAHVDANHWVVVYDADDRRVRIADPALGIRQQSREEFEARWSGYAALIAYGEGLEQAPVDEGKASWIWQFFRPYRKHLAAALVLALVAAALEMVLPIFTQIDRRRRPRQRRTATSSTCCSPGWSSCWWP